MVLSYDNVEVPYYLTSIITAELNICFERHKLFQILLFHRWWMQRISDWLKVTQEVCGKVKN